MSSRKFLFEINGMSVDLWFLGDALSPRMTDPSIATLNFLLAILFSTDAGRGQIGEAVANSQILTFISNF